MADWAWDLFRSFIGAGAGTAAVAGGISLWRDRGKKQAEATYLAMRLAVMMEKFASDCSSLISENRNTDEPGGKNPDDCNSQLPKLDDYPSDADGWKSIATDIAADCLNFRNRIAESQSSINVDVVRDPHDTEREVRRRASQMGLEAWFLALRLRSASGLKPIELVFDYAAHLVEAKAETEAEDAEGVRFAAEMFAFHQSNSD